MTLQVYLFSSLIQSFDKHTLNTMLPTFEPISPSLMKGEMVLDISDALNPLDLYDLMVQDFDPELVMVPMQESASWVSESFIDRTMHILKPGFYSFERFLYEVVLDNLEVRKEIAKALEALLDKEMIDTLVKYAIHEMNASKASKHLYIHRNTLNYRFSVFQEKTGLDPKDFHTISLVHALFHAQFMHSA